MTEPRITVNGESRALPDAPAFTTALDFLRGLGLTGAKEGCAEGECGACSVLVARPTSDGADERTQWTAINACLVPAAALDGQEVVTAEGLGTLDALHPVQREMAARGGSQCGYCTPGFVCSMAAEFYRADRTSVAAGDDGDHEHGPNGFDLHAMSGNLCRCTGYRPIRDAAWALGQPLADDPLTQRLSAATAGAGPDPHRPARRIVRPPARPRRGGVAARRAPRRHGRGRLHRLGRRGQPPRRAGGVRRGDRPAARAARARRSATTTSSSAPPSPCPRSRPAWPAPYPCSTRCGRCSRRG